MKHRDREHHGRFRVAARRAAASVIAPLVAPTRLPDSDSARRACDSYATIRQGVAARLALTLATASARPASGYHVFDESSRRSSAVRFVDAVVGALHRLTPGPADEEG
jgi:hypothetical protein